MNLVAKENGPPPRQREVVRRVMWKIFLHSATPLLDELISTKRAPTMCATIRPDGCLARTGCAPQDHRRDAVLPR